MKTLKEDIESAYGMLMALQPEVVGLPGETEDLDSIKPLVPFDLPNNTVPQSTYNNRNGGNGRPNGS